MAFSAPSISGVDVRPRHGDGQQAHGGEHAVAAAHVVGHHEGLVALVVRQLPSACPLRAVGGGEDALLRASLPYFFSSSSRNTRKATAGSVVVPDLEMMLTEKSAPSQQVASAPPGAAELMELPVK